MIKHGYAWATNKKRQQSRIPRKINNKLQTIPTELKLLPLILNKLKSKKPAPHS